MKTPVEVLQNLIKDIRIAMMTTLDKGNYFHSRPMVTHEGDKLEDGLWFITSEKSPKVLELMLKYKVSLTYQKGNSFAAIAGKGEIIKDKAKLKEIWSPAYNAWFPKGVDDPDICLIKVTPMNAEYWDSPSTSFTYALKVVNNILGKENKEVGEHEKVDF